MATKKIVVTAPLVVLLYDRTFLGGSFRESLRRRYGLYLGLGATWLLLAALVISTGDRAGSVGFGGSVTGWEYALTQCNAIPMYLGKSFWPTGLCLDYGLSLAKTVGEILPGALLIVALLLATLWACATAGRGVLGRVFLRRARTHLQLCASCLFANDR